MKIVFSITIIFLVSITKYCYSLDNIRNFNCKIELSTSIKIISPLEMSAPKNIKVKLDLEKNNLVDYLWNYKSVINDFELDNNNINPEYVEIKRKGYKKTLAEKDIRNGLYFKIYLASLKAKLSKQFIKPVNYNCS